VRLQLRHHDTDELVCVVNSLERSVSEALLVGINNTAVETGIAKK
jgi:hypothetical protein